MCETSNFTLVSSMSHPDTWSWNVKKVMAPCELPYMYRWPGPCGLNKRHIPNKYYSKNVMDHGYPTKTGAPMAFCKYFALALNEVPNAPTDPCATHQLVCVREHSTHDSFHDSNTQRSHFTVFALFPSQHPKQKPPHSRNHPKLPNTLTGLTLSVSPHSERSDHTTKKQQHKNRNLTTTKPAGR